MDVARTCSIHNSEKKKGLHVLQQPPDTRVKVEKIQTRGPTVTHGGQNVGNGR